MKSATPLQNEVYESIRSRILANEFPPGEQIPTEKRLAEELHVSRITVHRALQRLAQQGFVNRYPGKGTFVRQQFNGADQSISSLPRKDQEHPLLGFILPGIGEDFGGEILSTVIAHAEAANWSVIVSMTNQSQEAEEAAIQRAVQAGVKGLLVNPVYGEFYNEALLRLHLQNFPLVLVDKRLDKIHVPYVMTDNKSSAYELTKHVIDQGHKHIGFISPGVTATATLEDRFSGYLEALGDHGIPYEASLNLSTLPTGGAIDQPAEEEVYRTIRDYLSRNSHLTAVIATEYVYAYLITQICSEMSISLPDDLSIACFDSPRLVERNSLTHISQDERQIGETAVQMLLGIIESEQNQGNMAVQVPGTLIIGKSTAKRHHSPDANSFSS